MQIIVVGAGTVGHHLARQLTHEGHDITVVDEDAAALQTIGERLDVQTVQGSGSHPEVLAQAGADNAELILAVTPIDEINLVACQMAYSLFQVPRKVARVSQKSFLALTESHLYTPTNVPVDAVISPEQTVAEALVRTVEVPGAFEAFNVFEGKLMLIGTHLLNEENQLLNQALGGLNLNFIPLAAYRKERLINFESSDHMEAGDELYLLSENSQLLQTMMELGNVAGRSKRALIIGGGQVGGTVCHMLTDRGFKTKVIEKKQARAIELAEELSSTTVLFGEGLDQTLLEQENIQDMSVVLVTTASDTTNILSAVLAQRLGAKNVLAIINNPDLISLAESMGVEKILCPQEITVARVLRHLRPGKLHEIYSLRDDQAELIDLSVSDESALVGQTLSSIALPAGLKVVALMRGEDVFMNPQDRTLRRGDRLAVFGPRGLTKTVCELF